MAYLFDSHVHLGASEQPSSLERVARANGITAYRHPTEDRFLSSREIDDQLYVANPSSWKDFYNKTKLRRSAAISYDAIMQLTHDAVAWLLTLTDGFDLSFCISSQTEDFLANTGRSVRTVSEAVFEKTSREILESILAGYSSAAEGINDGAIGLRFAFSRHKKYGRFLDIIAGIAAEYSDRFIGWDILGSEIYGRDNGHFREVIDRVRQEQIDLKVHAGEHHGPFNIRAALELNPNAIGHGTRSLEDDSLIDELAKRGVFVEVCPSTIYYLIMQHIREKHPDKLPFYENRPVLPTLLNRGVKCVLGSDDPVPFRTNIEKERFLAQEMGVDLEVIDRYASERTEGIFRS